MTTNTHIAARLRSACNDVRRKSMPLADLIPMMQEAADALEAVPALDAPATSTKPEKQTGGVPAGWKLVPLEPTQAMVDAAWKFAGGKHVTDAPDPYYAYRTMLAAAPSPSAVQPLSEQQIEELERVCIRPVDASGWGFLDRIAFARAIERAHGIVTKETGNG